MDVLFRSAAWSAAAHVVGVVLSGVLDDGTAGLVAVKSRDGIAVVQDPVTAHYPNMPASALDHVDADYVVAPDAIGSLLARLCTEEIDAVDVPPGPVTKIEADLALLDEAAMNSHDRPGKPFGFSCPDCDGLLLEIKDGALVRYRCRLGHAWSAESLLGEHSQQLDTALWLALRGLEEKATLADRLGERAVERNSTTTARRYIEEAEQARRAANLIRTLVEAHGGIRHDADAERVR